jgi:hypothetical protein
MSNSFVMQQRGTTPPDAWAEIRTPEQVIRYRRVGAGHPVLVLAEQQEICPIVVRALTEAGAVRLIMPELPTEAVHMAGWAADFLEGIGATSVGLLATPSFVGSAIELAMLGAVQITRAVLVVEESGSYGRWCEKWQRGELACAERGMRVPLLLVHKGLSMDEIGPLVRQFFDGE